MAEKTTKQRATKPPPEFIHCPFKIVVDSNETAPYSFRDIQGSVTYRGKPVKVPLVIETVRLGLWCYRPVQVEIKRGKIVDSHRVGFADYTIQGFETEIQVERKSIDDLFSTLGGRRGRFEAEIKRLDRDCRIAYIMIEAGLADILRYNQIAVSPPVQETQKPVPINLFADDIPLFGRNGFNEDDDGLSFVAETAPIPDLENCETITSRGISPATVIGTMASWSMKYPKVHWVMAGNRGMAESLTFKLLQEFWEKKKEGFWN